MIEDTLDGHLEPVLAEADRFIRHGQELGVAVMAEIQAAMWSGRARLYLGPTDAIFDAPAASASYMLGRKAVACAHMNRSAEAQSTVRAFLDEFDVASPDSEIGSNLLAEILEAAVIIADRDAPTLIAGQVAPAAGQLHTSYYALTVVARHVGAARALVGDREGAEAAYREALEVCSRVQFRPEAALTHLALAELLLAAATSQGARTRPSNQAVEHLEFAIAELRAMGMEPALRRALDVAAARLGPAAARKLGRAVASGSPSGVEQAPATDLTDAADATRRLAHEHGLTSRELEILRLVAAGRSSRQIADELVLSARTVERHISNLYRKLEVRTRVQAAAYAHTHGLIAGD
jgi:DNA-binding NarL/FixJ family response regulator